MKTLILTLATLSISFCFSQAPVDSLEIQQLIDQGTVLLENSEHQASIQTFEQAKELAVKADDKELQVQIELKIIENYWRLRDMATTVDRIESISVKTEEWLGPEAFEMGEIDVHRGVVRLLVGEFDSALYYFDKGLEICMKYEEEKVLPVQAKVYNYQAFIYGHLGDLSRALTLNRKVLGLYKQLYGPEHVSVVRILGNISSIFTQYGLHRSALQNFEEAINILDKTGNRGIDYPQTLASLGYLYNQMSEYRKAIEYNTQALAAMIQLLGPNDSRLSDVYANLGIIFSAKGDQDSAIYYYEKGLEFENELITQKNSYIFSIYLGLAECYARKKDIPKAISYNTKAQDFANIASSDDWLFHSYSTEGVLYSLAGDPIQAEISFLENIDYLDNVGSFNAYYSGLMYGNLAAVTKDSKKYTESLKYSQLALESNHQSWKSTDALMNPPIEGVVNKEYMEWILRSKSEAMLGLIKKGGGSDEMLQHLLDTYLSMDSLVRIDNKNASRVDDQIDFLGFAHELYERAIYSNMLAAEQFDDARYLEACYYYSSSDKAVLLTEALNKLNAAQWSGIPDELLAFEVDLGIEIANTTTLMNSLMSSPTQDSEAINSQQVSLIVLNQRKDSLSKVFEEEYPDYYEIRYQHTNPDLSKVQAQLDDNSALLEYFVGDSSTYVFVIKNNDYTVHDLGSSPELLALVSQFRDVFKKVSDNGLEGLDLKDFVESSQKLYQWVIQPIVNQLDGVQKVKIVADGTLHYVPFDLLLGEVNDVEAQDYKSLPYLIRKFDIQNIYSTHLDFFQSRDSQQEGDELLSFAPSYQGLENQDQLISLRLGKFRDAMVPLKWNTDEVERISRIVTSARFTGQEASEQLFKEKMNDYKVIHLAMHAFVDEDDPMNSRLVFAQQDNQGEDGLLHTFELYNMKVNADLVVLSACETGYGKLIKGDGIMSLARGFAVAGVPSVVMSHWQVDDQSTSVLMEHFYRYLSEGLAKSEAMRKAKLDFLNDAGPNKEHPFFWGSFVVLGDDSPVFEKSWPTIYYVVILVAIIVIGFMFRSKRKVSNS